MPEASFGRATRWLTCRQSTLPLVRERGSLALTKQQIEARPVWNLCTYSLYLLAVNVLKV